MLKADKEDKVYVVPVQELHSMYVSLRWELRDFFREPTSVSSVVHRDLITTGERCYAHESYYRMQVAVALTRSLLSGLSAVNFVLPIRVDPQENMLMVSQRLSVRVLQELLAKDGLVV